MAADTEAVLSAGVLATVLDVKWDAIVRREPLEYWAKQGCGLERVTSVRSAEVPPSAACVKYGSGLEREALAQALLLNADVDAVPALIGCRQLPGGGVVVATQWVAGRTPDFWTEADLLPVFTMVGRFAAEWAYRVQACLPGGTGLSRRTVPEFLEPAWKQLLADVRDASWYCNRFVEHVTSVLECEDLLLTLGGSSAADACREIIAAALRLARRICSAPLTLDPGDFADENALLGMDGKAYLLDFDNVRIAAVVHWFESVGEDWSSQPAPSLVDGALRAFAAAWNATGLIPLDWEPFRAAHNALRVLRKCYELSYSLRDLAEGKGDDYDDVREFAQGCARDLPGLLERAMATL